MVVTRSSRPLLSVDEAISQVTKGLSTMPGERVPLRQALGRVLAEEIYSPHPLPPFDHSAMDGYALRSKDISEASSSSPIELDIVGEAAAGREEAPTIEAGQAARITTGAPIPVGADCVVPVESTDNPMPMAGAKLGKKVNVLESVKAGAFIRPAGLDVPPGESLLCAGQRLRPQDIGVLGSIGVDMPLVRRKPKVAILSTGDELVEVSQKLEPGLIRDANGSMVGAFVEARGGVPLYLGIAKDNQESVQLLLDEAVKQGADLILSTAGVSMGAHDYVRMVIESFGELSFWKVNVRPGKPLAYGKFREIAFIGLPGNPVSAWVTFALFVQTALAKMLGEDQPSRVIVQARLDEPVESDGRESYLRAIIKRDEEGYRARLTGSQDSAVITSLVRANGLLIVPAGVERMEAGTPVEVWLMGDSGMVEV